MNYTYIQNNERLQAFLSTFEEKQFHLLAVDIEAENNRHAYGVSIKLIRKTDGDFGAWGVGFDLGWRAMLYRNLTGALVLDDATSTLIAWNGGRKEFIQPHLHMGLSCLFTRWRLDFLPAIDLESSMENLKDAAQWSSGRLGLDLRSGLEIGYRQRAWLRLGMDRTEFTMGAGFRVFGVTADYGYSPHQYLGSSHRVSVTLNLNKDRFRRW